MAPTTGRSATFSRSNANATTVERTSTTSCSGMGIFDRLFSHSEPFTSLSLSSMTRLTAPMMTAT